MYKFLIPILILFSCSNQESPLPTVESVNLSKYTGKWFEIMSFPNRFQKHCTCTTAEYKQMDDYISVFNSCIDSTNQAVKEADGKAFIQDSTNSKLKVQFFWPFKGDYFIIDLAEDYSWVMVGAPSREYLWILARENTIDQSIIDARIQKAKELGFDTSLLQKTVQNDC